MDRRYQCDDLYLHAHVNTSMQGHYKPIKLVLSDHLCNATSDRHLFAPTTGFSLS